MKPILKGLKLGLAECLVLNFVCYAMTSFIRPIKALDQWIRHTLIKRQGDQTLFSIPFPAPRSPARPSKLASPFHCWYCACSFLISNLLGNLLFCKNYNYLMALFPWQATPTDQFNPEFIDRRKAGLENFLLHVALHKQLSLDQNFVNFLQQDDGWAESLATVSYLGKADAKLKSLSASFMLKKPDKKFEETKNYSNELHSNISNLLKMRAKLIDRVYGIHKLHANYSRVFGEWSSFEKPMSEGLVKAAHLMNVYASLTNCMDEEEQFADQMKEYLFYAESLRQVCRKQEMLQYEVERAESNLSAKSAQRQSLLQGKKGILSRWFTGVDTEEVKEFKLQQLDAQIHEAENQCSQTAVAADEFVGKALVDINQFQEQKVKDLKETLILYAILQIKMCKKGLSVWTNMRDCFENM